MLQRKFNYLKLSTRFKPPPPAAAAFGVTATLAGRGGGGLVGLVLGSTDELVGVESSNNSLATIT